jgi:CBS-domain-containing membrane protein
MVHLLKTYFAKMQGGGTPSPQPVNWHNALYAWVGGFIGIALVGWLSAGNKLASQDHLFLIGSFGATAVLLYGSPAVPFAQPRHVLLGHFLSALAGVTVYQLLPEPLWLSAALAVSFAILAMYLARATHPPGGATALIAVIGSDKVHVLGYWYVLDPVMTGILLLMAVALLVNNLSPERRYPHYWW